MRLVMERPVAAPVADVRRALGDPASLLADLSSRLHPLPPEPGMAQHWRVTAHLAGSPREARIWLPAPMPVGGCHAMARMDGIGADIALEAAPDGRDAAVLRIELRIAAAGLRGHALMAMLRLAEPGLRARLEQVLDRLAGALGSRQGAA